MVSSGEDAETVEFEIILLKIHRVMSYRTDAVVTDESGYSVIVPTSPTVRVFPSVLATARTSIIHQAILRWKVTR